MATPKAIEAVVRPSTRGDGGRAWAYVEECEDFALESTTDVKTSGLATLGSVVSVIDNSLCQESPTYFLPAEANIPVALPTRPMEGAFRVELDGEPLPVPCKVITALAPRAETDPVRQLDGVREDLLPVYGAVLGGEKVGLTSDNADVFIDIGRLFQNSALEAAGVEGRAVLKRVEVILRANELQGKLFDRKQLVALQGGDFKGVPAVIAGRLVQEVVMTRLNWDDDVVALLGRLSGALKAAIVNELVVPRRHMNLHFLSKAVGAGVIGKDACSAALLERIDDKGIDGVWGEDVIQLLMQDDVELFKARFEALGGLENLDLPIESRALQRRGLWRGAVPTMLELAAICGAHKIFVTVAQAGASLVDTRESFGEALQEAAVIGGSLEILNWLKSENVPCGETNEAAAVAAVAYHRSELLKPLERGGLPGEVILTLAMFSFDFPTLVSSLRGQTWLAPRLCVLAAAVGCWPAFDLALQVAGGPKVSLDPSFVALAANGGSVQVLEAALSRSQGDIPAGVRAGRLSAAGARLLRDRWPSFKASEEDVLHALRLDNVGFIQQALDCGDIGRSDLAKVCEAAIRWRAVNVVLAVADPAADWLPQAMKSGSTELAIASVRRCGVRGHAVVAMAVQNGLRGLLDVLLTEGVGDVNQEGADGETALSLAIRRGDLWAVRRLLAVSAIDVNKGAPAVLAAQHALGSMMPDWGILRLLLEHPKFSGESQKIPEELRERLSAAWPEVVSLWTEKGG